ncbi:hypothetical protein [Marinobacter sp. F4218]|uniref:hypothetical protein n=1 Tax=Marinobacter sp. F4218 TaxID=2862868 RepID=UPI001C636100|nr:hypothetical protein [Marinobacter sp. F4218]MBW7469462.1 hypothetical protein [Marinobacter sp. F4218]
MGSTDVVAWWGAVIATLVLLWDVVKWLNSGASLKSRIVLNTHYDDGEVIKREKTEHGETITYESYCHIEVVNTGSLPTTVMGIRATHSKNKSGMQMSVTQQVFTEHFGKNLPHVLGPGEVWSCRLPMDRYSNLFEHGTPEVRLSVSTKSKPLVIRASKSANKALQPTAEAAAEL